MDVERRVDAEEEEEVSEDDAVEDDNDDDDDKTLRLPVPCDGAADTDAVVFDIISDDVAVAVVDEESREDDVVEVPVLGLLSSKLEVVPLVLLLVLPTPRGDEVVVDDVDVDESGLLNVDAVDEDESRDDVRPPDDRPSNLDWGAAAAAVVVVEVEWEESSRLASAAAELEPPPAVIAAAPTAALEPPVSPPGTGPSSTEDDTTIIDRSGCDVVVDDDDEEEEVVGCCWEWPLPLTPPPLLPPRRSAERAPDLPVKLRAVRSMFLMLLLFVSVCERSERTVIGLGSEMKKFNSSFSSFQKHPKSTLLQPDFRNKPNKNNFYVL